MTPDSERHSRPQDRTQRDVILEYQIKKLNLSFTSARQGFGVCHDASRTHALLSCGLCTKCFEANAARGCPCTVYEACDAHDKARCRHCHGEISSDHSMCG